MYIQHIILFQGIIYLLRPRPPPLNSVSTGQILSKALIRPQKERQYLQMKANHFKYLIQIAANTLELANEQT